MLNQVFRIDDENRSLEREYYYVIPCKNLEESYHDYTYPDRQEFHNDYRLGYIQN